MKIIDLKTWSRKSHFEFFTGMDYPHFNVCFELDVTAVQSFAKEHGIKVFSVILYLSSHAANCIPEMKTRIRGDQVVEHESVHPAFTIMGKDNVFNYCRARFDGDGPRFFREVEVNTDKARQADSLDLGDPYRDDWLYITSLPWITFSSIQHPIHVSRNDSIPRLSWGRISQNSDTRTMPYSFQAHHGLVDGYHAGLFAQILQETFSRPESSISL